MIFTNRSDEWLIGFVLILCSSARLTKCDSDCVWNFGAEESTFGEQLFRAIFFPPFGIDTGLPCDPCTQLSNSNLVWKNGDTSLGPSNDSPFGVSATTLLVTILGCLSFLATKHGWDNKTRCENVVFKIVKTPKLPVSTKNERRKFRVTLDNGKKDNLRIIQGAKTFKISRQMCEFIKRNVDDQVRGVPGLNQGSQLIYECETRFSDLTRDDLFTTRQACKIHFGGQQPYTRNSHREKFQGIREEINLALLDAKRTKSQGEIVENTQIENRTNQMSVRDHGDASFIGPPRASSSRISLSGSDSSGVFLAEDVNPDLVHMFDASFEDVFLEMEEVFEETQDTEKTIDLQPSETSTILNSSIFDTTLDVSDFQKSFAFYGNDMVSVYQFAAVVVTKKMLERAREFARRSQAVRDDGVLQSLSDDEASCHLDLPD